jgi:non-ribosomal peptide synthetase component F
VEYWVKQLANAPAWDFPFQRSRPAAPQFEGCRRWIRFTPELSSQVRETADRAGATPFMVLLAAWAAQCARLTGVRDVVIGSLVAGRTLPETERLIGFFVNYLPLRIDCSGNPSFRALMERVRRVCLDGYEHQDAPFQAIVDRLGIARDPARHPVFSTSFTLHNGPMPAISVQGLLVEMVEFDDRLIRLDLEFDVWWSGERIEGFVVHNTALFDEDQIVTLIDDYQKLLKSLTANPDAAALAGPQLTDAAF